MATMKKAQKGISTKADDKKSIIKPIPNAKGNPFKDKKSDIQPISNEKGDPFKNKKSIIQPLKKGGKMSKKSKK
jgi:hypothetical protein